MCQSVARQRQGDELRGIVVVNPNGLTDVVLLYMVLVGSSRLARRCWVSLFLLLCMVLGSYQRSVRHPYHCKELNKIIGHARGGEAEAEDTEGSACRRQPQWVG